jgi:hypothetical protein
MLRKAARKHTHDTYADMLSRRFFESTARFYLHLVSQSELAAHDHVSRYDDAGLCVITGILCDGRCTNSEIFHGCNHRFRLQVLEIQWEKVLSFLLLPQVPQLVQDVHAPTLDPLYIAFRLFDPSIAFISYHYDATSHCDIAASICSPRLGAVCKRDEHPRMFIRNVLEPRKRKPELHSAEEKVYVDPVMRKLVKWSAGEGIAYREDVAVYSLVSVERHIPAECLSWCWS